MSDTNTTEPKIRLGQITARLSPISITADGLKELGFEPVATEKGPSFFWSPTTPASARR